MLLNDSVPPAKAMLLALAGGRSSSRHPSELKTPLWPIHVAFRSFVHYTLTTVPTVSLEALSLNSADRADGSPSGTVARDNVLHVKLTYCPGLARDNFGLTRTTIFFSTGTG